MADNRTAETEGNYPRNILVFTDGTGNSSGKLFKTNVWRTYKAADLADTTDPQRLPRQFAYYHDGVGTSSFKPYAILGGAFGAGLGRCIRDAYAFVCRTYREGDKIYIFGFSRGAFAARLIAALILEQGIARYTGSEAKLTRDVGDAYRAFRAAIDAVVSLPHVKWIRWLREQRIRSVRRAVEGRAYEPYDKGRNIHDVGGKPLEIEFVGVWDTVAAYGLPVDELTRAVDTFIWPLSMPDHDLSPQVKRAMHALSLDDERNTFHPQLWNEGPSAAQREDPKSVWSRITWDSFLGRPKARDAPRNPPPNKPGWKERIEDERLSQVWFAGVHSDVGGGYPDEGLSYVPLDWMMTGARRAGVRFCEPICAQYRALSDENGPAHDSRQGLAGYYRYNPRRIERLMATRDVSIERVKIHESVFRRIKVGQDGYAPIVLPPDFDVAKVDGTLVPGITYLQTSLGDKSAYAVAREHVYNWVWWRRIAYFATLFLTLTLAAAPLYDPALPKGSCGSGWCFLSEWVLALGLVLPGFAATWTDTFASHPKLFVALAALIALGLWLGGWCDRRIRDDMRRIWYQSPATKPDNPGQVVTAPAKPGAVNASVEQLRTRTGYRDTFWVLTHWIMPSGFLILVLYAGFALTGRLLFSMEDSLGAICRASPESRKEWGEGPVDVVFPTRKLCGRTGLWLRKGGTYSLTFTIPSDAPWLDGGVPAGPNGVAPGRVSWWWPALVPLRRRLTQPWFKPMARIGDIGTDDYPLSPKPSLPDEETVAGNGAARTGKLRADLTFKGEIVARSEGELFLYVNDAVLPFAGNWPAYVNNGGEARVQVRLETKPQ